MPITLTEQEKDLLLKDNEALQILFKQQGLYNFYYDVLGFTDMNNVHKDLCSFLNEKWLFKLILMPRYSFKSTLCTIGYSIYRLMHNSDMRILIYSDASTKAQGFLSSIKSHLEGKIKHSTFHFAYRWASDGRETKWNENQIVIRGRTTSFSEPSVDTAGSDTSLIGRHYDLVIFDDIVSDVNTTTKDQMDKVVECYQKALSLLKPGGEVIIIGTRWNFGDLYGRIIAENEEKESFKIFIIDGEDDKKYGKYCFASIGLTEDFLAEKRSKQGSYMYSCLYRNSPVDLETAVFKARDFAFYGKIKSEDLYITATCDPAGEGEDFTAITVVGTDNNMDMHILEIVNQHLQPSEIINEILRLHYKYTFKMFGLEMNFYRGMLRQELERRIMEERKENEEFRVFGIQEFEATSRRGQSKTNRIMALQPYHERMAIKFPGTKLELLKGDFSILAYQMIEFPHSAHDDILDSLAYHLPLIRRGGLVKKAELPYSSPAWFERMKYEQEIEKNYRLPRRLRRAIPDLAFS